MIFVCPKCYQKLNINSGGAAVCDKGHSYDRSRFGYYNLLLSDKGGVHGDNKEMILARREFLSRGFYEPLAEMISEICNAHLSSLPLANIVDAGCGEGYYTQFLKNRLVEKNVRIAAFDISKDAVRQAAKRECADEYAVAGSYHMPIETASVDLLLNTFSPLAAEETLRVVKPNGYFVMAIPAEEHLFGLKAQIYETPYKNTVQDTNLSGFELIDKREVRYTIDLSRADDIRALFMMTPYAYRTSAAGREKILSLDFVRTDAHFLILVYKRNDI